MKDKYGQVVTDEHFSSPLDATITKVWNDRGTLKGSVTLNGKKYKVTSTGNSIWMLPKGQRMTDVYPEAAMRKAG